MNQQAENLETEIRQLEERIYKERKEAAKVEEIIENSVSGESRRGGEDKMLDDLEKSVLKIYEECIGENEANISTIDMLRHIELRMETLTQEQEVLNQKKVSRLPSEFSVNLVMHRKMSLPYPTSLSTRLR